MAEFEIEYYVVVCEKYLKKVVCPYSLYSQNIRQKVTDAKEEDFWFLATCQIHQDFILYITFFFSGFKFHIYTYSKEISTQPLFLHFHLAPLEQCSAVKVLVFKLYYLQSFKV